MSNSQTSSRMAFFTPTPRENPKQLVENLTGFFTIRAEWHKYHSNRVLYRWADVLEWAQARLSSPRSSTSEADVVPGEADPSSDQGIIAPER